MNREEALAAFAAFVPDKWYHKSVVLPVELLEEIAVADLPIGVPVEVGKRYSGYFKGLTIFWDGRLVRGVDGSLWSIIRHSPVVWDAALGANFYFEIVHRSILNGIETTKGLTVDRFDNSPVGLDVRIDYRFLVDGANLKEAFDKARSIQRDLEAPAQQVLDDVTTTLAHSVDRVIGSHHAQVSELVARVESAKAPSDKGAALESLMEALFEQVPGFNVCGRDVRTKTEEIDLILLNDSQDPLYSRDGPFILVECKNWTTKPGRPDFSLLETKIRNRHNRCTVAFLVSWSGFAETAWRETLRTSRENYVIVCLAGSDVRRAALGGNFPEFLRQATLHALNR